MLELMKLQYIFLANCFYLLRPEEEIPSTIYLDNLTDEEINNLYQEIQQDINKLDMQKALANPQAFLTLCSAFDVNPAIIQQLLTAPQSTNIPQFGKIPPYNSFAWSTDYNAVIAAALFGKMNNLTLLVQSAQFDEEALNDAMMLAAAFGDLEVLKYLVESGVSLFSNIGYQRNPLLAASMAGQTEVVAWLLKQNPPELCFWGCLDTPDINDSLSPYAAALNSRAPTGVQCASLLQDYKASLNDQTIAAISKNDIETLNELLEKQKGNNIIFYTAEHMTAQGSRTLFISHNHLIQAFHQNNETFPVLLKSLEQYKSADIIETLMDMLNQIRYLQIVGQLAELTVEQQEWQQQCYAILEKNLSLNINSLTLTIEARPFLQNNNNDILLKCYSTIRENKLPITKIVLPGCPQMGNINDPMSLIAALLQNTSVTQCQLFLNGNQIKYYCNEGKEPLMHLLELILERNIKMAECKKPLFKDFIYNKYVTTINLCIEEMSGYTKEKFYPYGKTFDMLTMRENKCYSLEELATFTLFSIPKDHTNASDIKEISADENENIQNLISDAKKLKDMGMI